MRKIKLRRRKLTGSVIGMEQKRHTYIILVGKPEGKRSLEDFDLDGEDNIKEIE
jgi:hypothetical protein